jgi:hypothetical protein
MTHLTRVLRLERLGEWKGVWGMCKNCEVNEEQS